MDAVFIVMLHSFFCFFFKKIDFFLLFFFKFHSTVSSRILKFILMYQVEFLISFFVVLSFSISLKCLGNLWCWIFEGHSTMNVRISQNGGGIKLRQRFSNPKVRYRITARQATYWETWGTYSLNQTRGNHASFSNYSKQNKFKQLDEKLKLHIGEKGGREG